MKIIKIKHCLDCPFSFTDMYGKLECENTPYFNTIGDVSELTDTENYIPYWCELEDYKESEERK